MPRKPNYFNRVHTGYEWNKYNQTHYDHDKPPPELVQGYRFHIFYPDLVDKIKAPVYAIEKDGTSAETCVIRFHALVRLIKTLRSGLSIKNGNILTRKVTDARLSVGFWICTSTLNDIVTGDKLIGVWPENTKLAVIIHSLD